MSPMRCAYAAEGQDHFYELNPSRGPPGGWSSEGVAWCAPSFATLGAVPFYRLYSPTFGGESSSGGLWDFIANAVTFAVCAAGEITSDGDGGVSCQLNPNPVI